MRGLALPVVGTRACRWTVRGISMDRSRTQLPRIPRHLRAILLSCIRAAICAAYAFAGVFYSFGLALPVRQVPLALATWLSSRNSDREICLLLPRFPGSFF